jgi:plasmid stabilization system protein ParE
MKVVLLPPADAELEEAISYYNQQQEGLGDQFYSAFIATTRHIRNAPEAWKKVGENTRRINFKRFPYLVLYVVDGDYILITCIAHQHRKPAFYLKE